MALFILEEDGKTVSYNIPEGETIIGRHPDSGICLAVGTVSGRHAKITKKGSSFYLEDLGSRNGSFVNQQQLSERMQLRDNDHLRFGQLELQFDAEVSTAAPASAAKPPAKTGAEAPAALKQPGSTLPLSPRSTVSEAALNTVDFSIADGDEDMASIVGSIENKGRFGMLDAQPEAKLKAVLDISTSLAGTVDLQSLLPKILDTLFGIFKYADRGCILLKKEDSEEMVPRAFKHRRDSDDSTVRLSRTIVKKVIEEKVGILSADASSDSQFNASESIADLAIRSMICVPLLGLSGQPLGIISIDSQNPLGQFTEEDLEILTAVAGQAALAYEGARLLQSYVAKQKQDGEMEIAKTIQRALLPENLPTAEGYQFFASYDSAQAVGGDYYDCFELPNNRICLSFGDVAGKGVPGALIMSRMSSVVQSTMRHVHNVGEAIQAINDHMCDSAVEGRFVTYVLVIIDLNTHEMSMVNAGHMSPFLRKPNGDVEEIVDEELAGPPIGVVDEYPYDVVTQTLQPGETVVIITDGVDEAMNAAGDFYGKERVIEFIRNGSSQASELGKAMLADVRRHADGHPQNDDITIMAFGRNAS